MSIRNRRQTGIVFATAMLVFALAARTSVAAEEEAASCSQRTGPFGEAWCCTCSVDEDPPAGVPPTAIYSCKYKSGVGVASCTSEFCSSTDCPM